MNTAQRIFSGFVSFVLHPVFVPIYVTAFLLFVHPSAFAGFSASDRKNVMLIVLLNAVFFPILAVLLLRALGFIKSVLLHDQKDRIIPFIASGIFFFWTYLVFRGQEGYPSLIKIFFMGIFLASSAGLLLNIFLKISLHGMGMGGWVGLFLIIAMEGNMLMTWPVALVFLLTGLVFSARLITRSHNLAELVTGFMAGLLTQGMALLIVGS